MQTHPILARATSFAHLAGLGRAARAESDEQAAGGKQFKAKAKAKAADDREDKDDDADDKTKGGQRCAEDDDDADDKPKGKRAKAAENDPDDDCDDDSSDDGDKDDDAPAKGKAKGQVAGDDENDAEDDDKDEEMRGNSAAAQARRRERARCAAIFNDPAAAANVALAASLAFETSMSRGEALKVLRASAPAAGQASATQGRPVHRARADSNPNVSPTGGSAPSTAAKVDNLWDQARAANAQRGIGQAPRQAGR